MTQRKGKIAGIDTLVAAALKEDLGTGDVTVKALVPAGRTGSARIIAKANGVVYGLDAAKRVFKKVDGRLRITNHVSEGERVKQGDLLLTVKGRLASLLKGERTALNFLQHLSGVATLTSRFVETVRGTGARILDTRKTLPGLRLLEKAAVKAGGGTNHRMGLYDMILIKDNHLALYNAASEAEAVRQAVARALESGPRGIRVQVEVTTLEGALEAGRSGAHMVLLDNMTPKKMTRVMKALRDAFGKKRPLAEASGGISLANVKKVAAAGVDRISIGALTHSAPALDIAMYIRFD